MHQKGNMAKIPDPKEIQAQIDRLVNRTVDQQVEGKAAPAAPKAGAAKDPFAGMKKETPRAEAPTPTPPAAAAPSAPAAGGTSAPAAPSKPAPYQTYIEYEYVGEPDPDSIGSLPSEEMNYTAGERTASGKLAIAPAVRGDKRSNIEKVIAGERTSTSRQYAPKKGVVPGANLLLTVRGKPAAVVRITAVYKIMGSTQDGFAVLQDLATGTEVKKPIERLAASEGYDAAEYAKTIYNTKITPGQAIAAEYDADLNAKTQADIAAAQGAPAEAPVSRATSIGMAPGDVPVPPMGETTPSVAPTGLPEAPMPPVETPETQVTATTPTDATVAQGTEQGTSKPLAAGSNPAGGASSAFESMTATPEQIKATAAPADGDFGIEGETQPYTLPETDGRYVGIIGTAGRREDGARLTEGDYRYLVKYIGGAVKPNDVLISGGAAWADHVAVQLFLDGKVGGLVLHLPAELIVGPDGKLSFRNGGFGTAGNTANYYHSLFDKALKVESGSSLKQIQEAIDRGAVVTFGDGTQGNEGMKARNSLVARDARDFLVAMTFDPNMKNQTPKDGGTADTWRKHRKGHPEAKRRLVDIRAQNPDPSEGERLRAFRSKKGQYALSQVETEQTADMLNAMAQAEGEKGSLLDKASKNIRDLAMTESTAQGYNLQQALRAMQAEEAKVLTRAGRIAFLPTDKLVSAALVIAMLDAQAPVSEEIYTMIDEGFLPNVGMLKRAQGREIDVQAAIRFMRDRILTKTIELGKGENDVLITRILENAGVPQSAFAKTGADAPAYTYPGADAQAAEVKIKRVNNDLKRVLARIQKNAADLGPLMSHPEVAKRLYLVTNLLAGIEQDIDSEFAGEALPSRLRTDKYSGLPYLRALEQIDPIFEYIRMRADIDPAQVLPEDPGDRDPYKISEAVLAAGAQPPQSRGKRGRYVYDEAQLHATYKAGTPYRRYAFDINGEVHPQYMTLDELGLVTDKFDGFENPYAGLASVNEGETGRTNTSRATIGMHISTDSSARVEWVSRIPKKEVEVLRAIKKLLADKHPSYITPGTPDEIAIVPGAFTKYTRDASLVDGIADAIYNDVSNAMGKVYLVDVTGSRQSQVTIDGLTYYIGKGMYAFKAGDETGLKLAQEVSALEDDAGPSSRVSKPFKLGDRAEYPAITGELKYFRIDVDPVVHMTFAHNDKTLLSQRDAARFGEPFDPDQQITTPLKPAKGGKFQGMYLLSSEYTREPGFTYKMVEEPYNLELKNEDGTPMLNAETGKPVTVRMFRTVAVGERVSMAPGVEDFADYTDNSPTNIEFDEGLRFVIGNDIQLGRTLDGVDLIEDNYNDVVAMEIRQQQPVFLQGAERRARDRQERIEQGLDPVDETMSESDKAYRNFTEAGERVDHFGREYSFADHGEYDTDSPFAASVAETRTKERMQALAPGAGGEAPAEADVKALPQFTMEDFMRPEGLTPESQRALDQLVADYFYILRVRARDVSQMVPNPNFVEREGQIGWRALRGVVKLRGEMLRDLGYRRALALHRYQTREPAILNAVLFDIFAATGDKLDVANELTKQVYTDIEVEDNFVSTRKGKPSFRDTPIVDDADALAREFAFSVARRMLRERTPNVYSTSTEMMAESETSSEERAAEAERSGGSAEAVTDYKSELAQIAAQTNMAEGQTTPYTGVEIGESLQHTLEDGRTISASSPDGKEWVQAIMERERQGKIPEKVLTNMINALETAEEEAAIKALRSRIKGKEAPAPQPIEAPVAKRPAPRVNRVLDPMSVDERRAFANRAWALYSEHVAADGDGDAFVKTINRALSAATTVKGKENRFNQILNFVFDNNGTVMVPDVYFTDVNGNKTYPEPKVKNPQYNSSARRGSAFDATFTVEEMEKFVTEMSTMRTSKLAGGLREIIRYAKAQNKSAGKKKQLRFYLTMDPKTGMPKFSLSVSPTYPSQKSVSTPYAPGGVDREGKVKAGGEAFDDPFATMQGDANRLQSLTADDIEAVIRSAGADSAIKVVRRESEILSQAEGVASAEDFARAQPYDLVFTEGFDADEISGSLFDELPDHVKGDDRSKVMKIILDAAVRARFFQIMKTDLDQQGIDSSFITEDDLDPSAFKKVETPEGSKYALKPRLEQDGTFAGPFSRRGKGPVRTLKLLDIEGDDRTSRALKAVLERIKQGGTYAEQLDMDEAARQAANVLDFRNKALGLERDSARPSSPEPIDMVSNNVLGPSSKLPRFSPGAKAGIAGGTIAGTLAAYLQFGADEQAKEIALASLPSQVAFEALGAVPKVGGPVAAATGLGLTYATGGDMLRALAGITGSVVGGIAGTGAGLFTGPGAFVSGLAGSTAGYMIADNLYSAVTGKSPASQVPNNVARSNSLMEQRTRTPGVRDVMPVVNRDIAELERMGG